MVIFILMLRVKIKSADIRVSLINIYFLFSGRNKITVSSEKLVFAERKINVAEGVSLADCLNHW